MNMGWSTVICGGLLLGMMAWACAGGAHPINVHDMLAMDRISEPQVSPDGRWVVFTLRVTDMEANRGRNDLWLVGVDGQGLKRLTTHEASDTSPVWSPDGRWVYFLSTRGGSSQVWRIPTSGGEAELVTRLPLDVGSFVLSPCGHHLAVSLEVFPDAKTLQETVDRLDARSKAKTTGQLYDRLFVRHWDTWADGRRSHLFLLPVAGGDPVDLMAGLDADCPSKPFGGSEEYTFVPDGASVVFTARDAGVAEAWSTNFDLYMAGLDGRQPPRKLTTNPAWDTQPVFSPDGKTLAYLAMSRPGYEADRYRIVLRAWPDGPERVLTEAWDRSPQNILWSRDGKTIFVTAENLGQHGIFAIDTATAAVRTVVGQGSVSAVRLAGEELVYAMDNLKSPVELYRVKPDGSTASRVTTINDARLAGLQLGEPEQYQFKGWNGETVYGYVLKPAVFDPQQKYPVAFLIHGGPQGSFGNHFHYRWNPQAYAGAGYAVVMVDFHGSTGYGQAFTDAIRGDWGGKPLQDLQKGLAAALERYSWLDGDRVGALGASYGGFMINWIAGNWPDRFRCLVCHDGNLDERMAYFDTEELWFPEWDHEGTPWGNPAGYNRHNPVDHVAKWKTPMLVIHGGKDFRVVETQGLSTFTALQRLGIPSKFLYFPDENHWVLKPHNSILWHETVLGWLDQWLKQEAR